MVCFLVPSHSSVGEPQVGLLMLPPRGRGNSEITWPWFPHRDTLLKPVPTWGLIEPLWWLTAFNKPSAT